MKVKGQSMKKVIFEDPNGWYVKVGRSNNKQELNLLDSERNAKMLSQMDFDDGVFSWFKD
mgnify:CR=1 FL=1